MELGNFVITLIFSNITWQPPIERVLLYPPSEKVQENIVLWLVKVILDKSILIIISVQNMQVRCGELSDKQLLYRKWEWLRNISMILELDDMKIHVYIVKIFTADLSRCDMFWLKTWKISVYSKPAERWSIIGKLFFELIFLIDWIS